MDLNTLNNLEKIAKVWQLQLNLEYCNRNKNTRLSFKDIGSFCELLAIDYNNGFIGSGSGGMGYDLVNFYSKKGVEVKSCCTIQNSKCKKCGTKFNDLFTGNCPKCNSTDFELIRDSRFGIDAKEFLRQYKNHTFENFTMCYVREYERNIIKKEIIIRLEWFKVSFYDEKILKNQLEYFEKQNDKGKKPHCNLVPYSYDFYKLCPEKIDDITIRINYGDLNIDPLINRQEFEKNLKVPIDIIPTKNRELFMLLNSYVESTGLAECKDFAVNMPYKNKNLGKNRGDTRTKVDELLK